MDTHMPARKFIDKKLRFRLGLFLLIAVGIFGFIVYDVVMGALSWWIAGTALLFGLAIGYVLGRAMKAQWHETEDIIVLKMDRLAMLALGAYVVIDLSRNWLLGHWLTGVALTAAALAVLSGALFGRFLGMLHSVRKRLRERTV
jgi:hypothetical protein